MKTIKHLNISSVNPKISLAAICFLFLVGCQERQVGTPTKSTATGTQKIAPKSKGGEFRVLSVVSDNTFAITPKPGFKINVEYPWKMAALDGDVKVGEIKLDEKKATIGIQLPKEMVDQKKDFKVKGSFSVCNDEKCLIYTDEELKLTQVP